ncbi:MAG: CRISPR-associated endonuclease Cas1 [Burkholderiales bacterium]
MTPTSPRPTQGCVVHQRRAAYLVPDKRVRLLAEGESLGVYRQLTLATRLPLGRLDRIVCNKNVDWCGAAITACLERGIPITWVDVRGTPLGDCVGRVEGDPEVVEMLVRYLDLPDWESRLEHWTRRRRLAVLVRFAKDRAEAGNPLTSQILEQCKRDFVYRGQMPASAREYRGWFDALIASRLHSAGLPSRLWGAGPKVFNLARRLADLLIGEFSLDIGILPASAATVREKTLFFEAWRDRAELRLVEIVASLLGHVAREVA